MEPVSVQQGDGPVVLGIPHAGIWLPENVETRLNARGLLLTDTDWHVDRLYGGLLADATLVKANFHRYQIDANRDPSGASLYPGQNTTGLCPLTDFDGNAIWREGEEPDGGDIVERTANFHAPYHEALAQELERVRKLHGVVILYDCHSIRSRVPYLFEGILPDFNIGTNDGTSCSSDIESFVKTVCASDIDSIAVDKFGSHIDSTSGKNTAETTRYTSVLNGRFKGGWTTRRYGRPHENMHAIQMELAQSTHLKSEEPPFAYDEGKAERLRIYLGAILNALNDMALSGALKK